MPLKPRTTVTMLASVPMSPAVESSTQHRSMRGFLSSGGCSPPGACPKLPSSLGNGPFTKRRHLSISSPSIKVAMGQPGTSPEVGCLDSPMASRTLILRLLLAMQGIGPAMAGFTPESRKSSARRSNGTLS